MHLKEIPNTHEFNQGIHRLAVILNADIQEAKRRFKLYWSYEDQASWEECLQECIQAPFFLNPENIDVIEEALTERGLNWEIIQKADASQISAITAGRFPTI